MFAITVLTQDGSVSKNLCSEQQIVREISSYTPVLFAVTRPDESSMFHHRGSSASRLRSALEKIWGPEKSVWSPPLQKSAIEVLIEDNLLNREEEPEDSILVASGLLPRLLAQARQEPPSLDWERELDEL